MDVSRVLGISAILLPSPKPELTYRVPVSTQGDMHQALVDQGHNTPMPDSRWGFREVLEGEGAVYSWGCAYGASHDHMLLLFFQLLPLGVITADLWSFYIDLAQVFIPF